ncbi:MAG: gliding motility protein GldM, partial [Lutibacter sp.]
MASGKLSARQKMINLMYLIFIAMLAMNMSKEVLSAFGFMNEKLVDNNMSTTLKNNKILANIATKAGEQPEKYKSLYGTAKEVNELSNKFNEYLESKKSFFLEGKENVKDYEAMDQTSIVDEHFFSGDKFTKDGNEFLKNINEYRVEIINIIGEDSPIASNIMKRFDTSEQDVEGGKEPWLKNRYEGFPLISTITNITSIQTDIKTTQSEIFGTLLG